MRIFRVLVLLLAIGGCSSKTLMVHHILPVSFSGVYVIQKGQDDSGGYKVDGARYIFTIPENGILKVTPDVFENYCTDLCGNKVNSKCKVISASFSDGKAIPMFSPISQPADSESDRPLLLGLLGGPDSIWFAVGNYKQLNEFFEKVRLEKYQGLERYLPPNTPFQSD